MRRLAVALALAMVLAGCAVPGLTAEDTTARPDERAVATGETTAREPPGPTATAPSPTDPGPTPTERSPTAQPDADPETVVGESAPVAVEGDLPVDATRVYRRVERLMNVTDAAPTVRVVERDRALPRLEPNSVQRALGFGNATGDVGQCGRFPSARTVGDEVHIDPRNVSPETVELVLAHEFVHTLQHRIDGVESPRRVLARANGLALVEGSAVYVTDAYAQRYDARWGDERPLAVRECFYRQAENRTRLLAGQYYFGGRHFERRVDSPSELSAVFASPPRTTEQLVHGETPATEPAAPLSVSVPEWERGDGYRRSGGELLVRAWLATALPESRVDTAATGWGNDTLLVSPGSDRRVGVAWVLRWDTGTDAEEFAAAVAALEPALESRNATAVRSVRVSAETVVVFAGPAPWVANATASGSNGTVTVSPGGAASDPTPKD